MIYYLVSSLLILVSIYLLDRKYQLLRDESLSPVKKPYSFGRVQTAWWTIIVAGAIVTILIKTGEIPELDMSVIALLGISAGTMAAARVIDGVDQARSSNTRHQDQPSAGFIIDILSDENGVSMSRLQAVLFNLVVGAWFFYSVLNNLHDNVTSDLVIPSISDSKLGLLGVSVGAYAAIKTTENKP